MPRALKPGQVAFYVNGNKVTSAEGLRAKGFNPDICVLVENEDGVLIVSQNGHGINFSRDQWMFLG